MTCEVITDASLEESFSRYKTTDVFINLKHEDVERLLLAFT